jgi:hypothetical protein
MLVPLTRETFEQIIPIIATGAQYGYFWGKWSDFLRRLLISVVALTITWLVGNLFGPGGFTIKIILDIIAGLYWLWCPVYLASIKNNTYRRIPYAGFWRGRVLDAFITEELVGEEETVNQRGDLVIIENIEKRINLLVGDQSGFKVTVQAPLRRIYKGIRPGAVAELLVLSKQPDLETISQITDVYLPQQNLWVGEYPYLRRDIFSQVSQDLGGTGKTNTKERRPGSYIVKRKRRN